MKFPNNVILLIVLALLSACGKQAEPEISESHQMIKDRLAQYADVKIETSLDELSEKEQTLLKLLVEAGQIADKIFWYQSSHDAIAIRDSLKMQNTDEAKDFLKYVMINFGPYDPLFDNERFVGSGPAKRPPSGGFYPEDITKEEFEAYISANPEKEAILRGEYSIVVRSNGGFDAVPYHRVYPETELLAEKLEEAADYTDNESFRTFLLLRAVALRTDNYFDSDLAWMDIKDNKFDIVIGPIENYQDELYNYRTAHEAVVMIKDEEASRELDVYINNMNNMEQRLPIEDKYKNENVGMSNIIQSVKVVYFGGDCQQAIKTIASVLPNDPKVADAKGRKINLFTNHLDAKFSKIVKPIGETLLEEEYAKFVDAKAFSGFVTLHEVAHALGPRYVYGTDIEVRHALKERYSAMEECKADILSIYNHKVLNELGIYADEYLEKAKATYLSGLYRSIRFGSGAHYQANLIQLNYLRASGAIEKHSNGKFAINDEIFFERVAELANIILMIQAEGNYEKAGEILTQYAVLTNDLKQEVEILKHIPRDIQTEYIIK